MAPNLVPGTFKIVSLIDGQPAASVNHSRIGTQSVFLNGPVTTWRIKREGRNTYRLSVGKYAYTGVVDDKVTASINARKNLQWIATYREAQDAYTIEPANDQSRGWTVPSDESHGVIEIKIIIEFQSEPPRYLTSQLFRFEPVDA